MDGKKLPHREKRRGERSRSVSWMAVETYDLQKHRIRPLTDGERSRLSKARREIAALKNAFVTALEKSAAVYSGRPTQYGAWKHLLQIH